MAGANFNKNAEHALETGSTLAKWLPAIASGRRVSVVTHSAGALVALEMIRLLPVGGPPGAQIENLITMQGATANNVFNSPLGSFDNLSHNGWFDSSLSRVTKHYENFYSSKDDVLGRLYPLNEGIGFSKVIGHPLNIFQREALELTPRTAWRISHIIPAIHSPGTASILAVCRTPHDTPALGYAPLPLHFSTDCSQLGYGIDSHSSLRERNHHETYRIIRRILEIVK